MAKNQSSSKGGNKKSGGAQPEQGKNAPQDSTPSNKRGSSSGGRR